MVLQVIYVGSLEFPSPSTDVIGGQSNAVTGGGSVQSSTSTRQVCAAEDWLSREVPLSNVTTLGLPCFSSVPTAPGTSGSYQAPVGI
jgi:hypothetical protein